MFKNIIAFILALILSFTFCSCGVDNHIDDSGSENPYVQPDRDIPNDDTQQTVYEEVKYAVAFEENETFSNKTERKAAEIIDPAIKNAVAMLNTVPKQNFSILDWEQVEHPTARDGLAGYPEALEWYDFIYEKMSNMEYFLLDPNDYGGYEELYLPFLTAEVAVIEDHREVYMCGTIWPDDNETIYPVYFMPWDWVDNPCSDKAALQNETDLYNAVVDRIFEKMPSGLDNYHKVCYLAFVIVSNVKYDYGNYDDVDCFFYPYDALVKGSTVCRGYAMGLYELCKRAGISCWYCTGMGQDEFHAWVRIDTTDGFRAVDITWYDNNDNISSYMDGDTEHLFMTADDLEYYGYREGVQE